MNTKFFEWEPYFAWFPLFTLEGNWVWMQNVYRRWVQIDCPWASVDLSCYHYTQSEEICKFQHGSTR